MADVLPEDDGALEYGDEPERVEAWRLKTLLDVGYPLLVAEKIAVRADIDLHRAVDLLKAGCTQELAAEILL